MENRIGTHILQDVIYLYPVDMLDNGNPEITVSDGRVCIIRDDWKIVFCGGGIVHLQKGDNEEQTCDAHDYMPPASGAALRDMMQEYERNLLYHEIIVKCNAKRDEILEAAAKLRDAGAISPEALEKIRENFGQQWVLKQFQRELYGEE